jgi:hypothetical protein
MTMEFLTVDSEAPGDADESWSDISFKSANEGAVLEGPTHKPQTVKTRPASRGRSGLLWSCWIRLLTSGGW